MTKNPIINALAAIAYIGGLVALMFYGPVLFGHTKLEEMPEIFVGITMISIFVFSAATMGYIFLYNPILLILAGDRKEGTTLFLKTVGAFGASAFLFVLIGLIATSTF